MGQGVSTNGGEIKGSNGFNQTRTKVSARALLAQRLLQMLEILHGSSHVDRTRMMNRNLTVR